MAEENDLAHRTGSGAITLDERGLVVIADLELLSLVSGGAAPRPTPTPTPGGNNGCNGNAICNNNVICPSVNVGCTTPAPKPSPGPR